MSSSHPYTASSDSRRSVPAHPGARLDRAEAAVASLRAELGRLERLGLEPASSLCRQQLRYWEFVRALFTLQPTPAGRVRARA